MHLRGVSGGGCKQDKFSTCLRRKGREYDVEHIHVDYRPCLLLLSQNIAPRDCNNAQNYRNVNIICLYQYAKHFIANIKLDLCVLLTNYNYIELTTII